MNDAFNLPALAGDDPEPTIDSRQQHRIAGLPEIYRTTHERLACELALHLDDPVEVFRRYNYTPEQALELTQSPAFAALVARITAEVRESGLSFKQKARAQAEELLANSFEMATDPLCASSVRADLIKWTAKMAGYEPREKDDNKTGGGLNLSITFAGQQPVKVIETQTIEQEG
jgi:hypothetical protein